MQAESLRIYQDMLLRSTFLAVLSAAFSLSACHSGHADGKPAEPVHGVEHEHGGDHLEVAVYMGRVQRYHEKLWLAGKEGNAELAGFYLHELEEALEAIADAGIEEDGVKLAPLVKSYGLATIERMEKKLESEGVAAMHAMSDELVVNCNACHTASGYPFIRIRVPDSVDYPGQDFAPAR